MKQKHNKKFYLDRAVDRFKLVMKYFNITRVKAEKSYHIDGKFNLDKFRKHMAFLNSWSRKSNLDKNRESDSNRRAYAKYSTIWNYTTGIPYELIEKVLGTYRDEDGVKHNISLDEVISILEKKDYIRVVNYGSKFKKDESGKCSPKCHWHTKYLFKNEKYWYKMMNENDYDNWWDFIKEEDDRGFYKIWVKWVNQFRTEEPITREEIYDMWKRGGISMKVLINLDMGLFQVSEERVRAWLSKALTSNTKYEDKTSIKEKYKFWNRIVYGNLKGGTFTSTFEEFARKELNSITK